MEEAFIGLELDRETSPIKSPSSHQIKRDFSKQFSQQTSVTVEASETTVAIKTDKEKVTLYVLKVYKACFLLFSKTNGIRSLNQCPCSVCWH